MIHHITNNESPELIVDPMLHGIEDFINIDENEDLQYFFVSDYLGSSSFITDVGGDAVQHLQYMPPDSYRDGEHFVNQTSTSWETPYKFSGKEKDSETGYSYFGARYYDSDLSVWLSVDPLATIYPMLSPYAYVANNPIIFYDPDGKIIALVVTSMANEGLFNAGPKGHMAIIVGNDEIGYHLFSLEGPKGPYKNYASKSNDHEKFGDVLFPESLLSKQYVYYQHSESSLEALYEYMGNNAPGTFNKKKKGNGYDRILALNNTTSEQEAAFLKFMEGQSTEDFTYEFATNNCSSFSMNMINQFFGNMINDKTAIDIPNREFDKISRDTKNWTVIKDAKQPQMPSNIELPKEKLILGSEGYGN